MTSEEKREDRLYYYYLYHMIGHWSALMASIAGLIALLLYSGTDHRYIKVVVPSVAIYFASVWFNCRMYRFSNLVHSTLGFKKVRKSWLLPHGWANLLAFGLTTLILGLVLWVTLRKN